MIQSSNTSLVDLGNHSPLPHNVWPLIFQHIEYNNTKSLLSLLRTCKALYCYGIPRLEQRQYIDPYGKRTLINELKHFGEWFYDYHDCNCNMYCTCGDAYKWKCCYQERKTSKCTANNEGRTVWNVKHEGSKLECKDWTNGKLTPFFITSNENGQLVVGPKQPPASLQK